MTESMGPKILHGALDRPIKDFRNKARTDVLDGTLCLRVRVRARLSIILLEYPIIPEYFFSEFQRNG